VQEKVAFLSQSSAYPDCVQSVETRRTHMSWVFLTDKHAWKLKKPVCTEYVDFSTPEARRLNCIREVRLNRRLAEDVYQGVVPLILDKHDNLQLSGSGDAIDWLLWMRRLPSDRMLDDLIARHAVTKEDRSKVVSVLAAFYKKASPLRIKASE